MFMLIGLVLLISPLSFRWMVKTRSFDLQASTIIFRASCREIPDTPALFPTSLQKFNIEAFSGCADERPMYSTLLTRISGRTNVAALDYGKF